ncbi:MAG: hypothetical protein FWF68_04385 [Spirochaetes bacterium]|nr:hypothetical protein [Spirochaetota bacterium]
MKHKKNPQLRAGYLRGCKSGFKIITNSKIKNNAPVHKVKVKYTSRRMVMKEK